MKNRSLLTLVCWIIACVPLPLSAEDYKEIRSLALGTITAPLSSPLNPSALSLSPSRKATFSCQNNYLIRELSTFTASYQQPARWVDFSLLLNSYGFENYRRTRCGINVGKLLTSQFSLGIAIWYDRFDMIGNQSSYGMFSADIGLQYVPVDNLRIGMVLRNPFRINRDVDNYQHELPVALFMGVEMQMTTACRTFLEVEKENNLPICFKTALEYLVAERLALRVGVLTAPLMPTFGLGSALGRLEFDLSASYHPVLGCSPGIALHYLF